MEVVCDCESVCVILLMYIHMYVACVRYMCVWKKKLVQVKVHHKTCYTCSGTTYVRTYIVQSYMQDAGCRTY